jgi:hypothetical protein
MPQPLAAPSALQMGEACFLSGPDGKRTNEQPIA